MNHWGDDRRYQAALHQQAQINEDVAERGRAEAKKGGGGFSFLLFIVAVVFFKPFAEYCIDLYNTLAGHVQSFGALLGF